MNVNYYCLWLNSYGFSIIGYDLNDEVTRSILERKTPFHEPFMDEYLYETLNDTFFPTSGWADIISQFSLIDGIFFTLGASSLDSQSCGDFARKTP